MDSSSFAEGGGGEGALQTIAIATTVLQCKIVQRETNCALLLNDVKAVEEKCNKKKEKNEEIKMEIVKLDHRKQTLLESIDSMDQSKQTLETVRADLRKQLQLEKIKTADHSREHATILRHYEDLWQTYLEKYRTFPMAKEVEEVQIELKKIKINLAVMKQAFAEEKEKNRQLKEIRRKRKHIAGVKAAEAYVKYMDTVNRLKRSLEQKKCKAVAIESLKAEKVRILENIAEATERVSLMAKERAQKRAEFGFLSYVRSEANNANTSMRQITRVPPLQLVKPLMNKLTSSVDFNSYTDSINSGLSNRMRMACTPPKRGTRVVTVTGVVRTAEANKSIPLSQGVTTGQLTASEAGMHSTRSQLTPAIMACNPPKKTVPAGGFCAVQKRSTMQQERQANANYLPAEKTVTCQSQENCIDNEMEVDCVATHDDSVSGNHTNEFSYSGGSDTPMELASEQTKDGSKNSQPAENTELAELPVNERAQTMNAADHCSSGTYVQSQGLPIQSQYFSNVSTATSDTNPTSSFSTTMNTRQSRPFPIQTATKRLQAIQQSMNSENQSQAAQMQLWNTPTQKRKSPIQSEIAPMQAGTASQNCSAQNQSRTVTEHSHNVLVLPHNIPLESHNKVPIQTAAMCVAKVQSQSSLLGTAQSHTSPTQAATVLPETDLIDVYEETASYCKPSEEGNKGRYIATFASPTYSFTDDTACSGYSPPNSLPPNEGIGTGFDFNFGPTQNQPSGASLFSARSAPNDPPAQQPTFVGFCQQSFAVKPSKNSIFSLF